jgi:hypothetical protein
LDKLEDSYAGNGGIIDRQAMSLITRRNMTQKCPGSGVKTLQTGRDTKWAMTEVSGYIAMRKVGSKVQPRLRKLRVTEAWPCRSISANQKAVFESDIGPGCRHSAKGGDIKKAQATSDSVSLWVHLYTWRFQSTS